MDIVQAIILAIIEGFTEFLPVSSTGHMIIASDAMGIASHPLTKLYEVGIQFGAILAVVVIYYKKFLTSKNFDLSFFKFLFNDNRAFINGLLNNFMVKLFIAFIPAAIFGKLVSTNFIKAFNIPNTFFQNKPAFIYTLLKGDYLDFWLENYVGVAIALIVGGIVLLFVDKYFIDNEAKDTTIEEHVNYKSAFFIGMFQVLALFPGVSRSAATIIGGLQQKLNRKTAAEFSFFLAVPTMFAATAYKLLKFHQEFGIMKSDINLLIIGNIVAFIAAIIAIKSFIGILNRFGFKIFGVYRIVLGVLLLVTFALQKSGIA